MPTLIWNEDFESGTIGSVLPGGTSNASLDTSVFFSGAQSARFQGDPAWGLKSFSAGAVTVFRGYLIFNSLPANGGEVLTLNGGPRFGRDQTTGKLGFVNGTSVTMDRLSNVTVVAGQWYRVEFRLNQSANPWVIDWMIDGVAQTQITYAVAAGSVSGIYLGRTVSLGPSISLNWDGVAASQTSADYPLGPLGVLYSRALSDKGLDSSLYVTQILADAPVGYWRLDELSGTVAASQRNSPALDGTYYEEFVGPHTPAGLGTSGAVAYADAAVTLNGTDEFVLVPASPLHGSLTTAWSVEAWVKPTAVMSGGWVGGIVCHGYTSGALPFILAYGGAGGIPNVTSNQGVWLGIYAPNWATVVDPVDAPLNVWTHYIGTYDGTTLRLYRNGSLVASGGSAVSAPTTEVLRIGRRWDGTNYFPGGLDEVAVYGTTLSASRVLAHYNAAGGDSIAPMFIHPGGGVRPVADNGLVSFSDSLAKSVLRSRALADTGVTVNAVLVRGFTKQTRKPTDAGLVLVENLGRTFTPFIPSQPPLRRRVGMTIVGEREFSDLFR